MMTATTVRAAMMGPRRIRKTSEVEKEVVAEKAVVEEVVEEAV